MTVVIDTSVLIDHLRGNEQAQSALQIANDDGERLVASVLTRVEVLAGMRLDEEDATFRLLGSLDWIEVDAGLADHAGALANRYLRSHPGIDPVDYVIAATAESLGAQLWTQNTKHFPMFPGLRPAY